MRPSTIFILTVAILLGVAAVIAAKVTGLYGQKPAETPVVKAPETQILVAAKNLFADDMIDQTGVRLRALRDDERADYEKNKDQYLPAVLQAAVLRVAKVNIEADKPILRSALHEMAKPEPLNARLLPQMRAVNLALMKDQSAGGLVQVGEWVDVLLTSNVDAPDGTTSTKTANIASKVRVIAKRNVLWSVFASLKEDKPVQYTVEASPYRVALIEYGKKKGQLSIAPLPLTEQKELEQRRNQAMANPDDAVTLVSFEDPRTPAYQIEANRVEAFAKGELAVGDADLIRIFGIDTSRPAAVTPVKIESFFGIKKQDDAEFESTDGAHATPKTQQMPRPVKPDPRAGPRLRPAASSSVRRTTVARPARRKLPSGRSPARNNRELGERGRLLLDERT